MHPTLTPLLISLLFLAVVVSGQPQKQPPSYPRGGHHPNRHRRGQGQGQGQQNTTDTGAGAPSGVVFKSSTVTHSVGDARRARRPGTGHHPNGGHRRWAQPPPPQSSSNAASPPQSQPQGQRQRQRQPQPPPQPHPQPPPAPQPQPLRQGDNRDNNTNPARMFGWDPQRAREGCGPNCDQQYFLLKQEFLIAHNWVRLLYKQPPFVWDEKLAGAARQYAMNRSVDCQMVHSEMPYGENIFWGKRLHWMASDAVFYWYKERQWFDFKNLKCVAPPNSDCGHFTQIVWKDSVRLGCAIQQCRDQSLGMLIICEYDPPGNYENENPLDDNNAKRRMKSL